MKKLFIKAVMVLGSLMIMIVLSIMVVFVHLANFVNLKIFNRRRIDPFHDSRRHPLNDPDAPRG